MPSSINFLVNFSAPFFEHLDNGNLVPQSTGGEETSTVVVDDSFEDIVVEHISVSEHRVQQSFRERLSVKEGNRHGDSREVPELLLGRRRSPYAQSFTNYGEGAGEIVTYFEDTPYRAHPQSRRKPRRSRLERPMVEKVGAAVGGGDSEGVKEMVEVPQEEMDASQGMMSSATEPTETEPTATESLEEVDEAIADENSSQEEVIEFSDDVGEVNCIREAISVSALTLFLKG